MELVNPGTANTRRRPWLLPSTTGFDGDPLSMLCPVPREGNRLDWQLLALPMLALDGPALLAHGSDGGPPRTARRVGDRFYQSWQEQGLGALGVRWQGRSTRPLSCVFFPRSVGVAFGGQWAGAAAKRLGLDSRPGRSGRLWLRQLVETGVSPRSVRISPTRKPAGLSPVASASMRQFGPTPGKSCRNRAKCRGFGQRWRSQRWWRRPGSRRPATQGKPGAVPVLRRSAHHAARWRCCRPHR